MIYLIARIFIYLLFALAMGAAAGWLWRNLRAASREAELERALMDSRSRLPQLDTTLRDREQRLERSAAEVRARDEALAEREQQLTERDRTVAELERTCGELRHRLDGAVPAARAAAQGHDEDELSLHPGDPHAAQSTPAEPAPAAEVVPASEPPPVAEPAPPIDLKAVEAAAAALALAESERDALQAELAGVRDELERAGTALASERRRVVELTRERDLQHQALKALEQQLALFRDDDDQVANG